jgi:transposase InsO family protein
MCAAYAVWWCVRTQAGAYPCLALLRHDTHSQARTELFSYIMGFYNRQRRRSTLGYISPCSFESQSERLSFTPLN